jgi:hypothetical protein
MLVPIDETLGFLGRIRSASSRCGGTPASYEKRKDHKIIGGFSSAFFCVEGELPMATRLQRLAEFDGNGEPPSDEAVQVLCEDKSGTYQLPFPCRRVNGEWRNSESGSLVEATVVGWRRARV